MNLSSPNSGRPLGGAGRRALAASRLAAAAYVPCFFVATIVSARRGHKAEPLGLSTPFPVQVDAIAGLGTGLAAPWPMIVWLWRSRRLAISGGAERRRSTAHLALLGAMFLAGAAAEPVSRRLLSGRLRPDETVLVTLNFALPAFILGGALASLAAERSVRNAAGTPLG